MTPGSWQGLDPGSWVPRSKCSSSYMTRCWVLGPRGPGGGSSRYIGDISDGDDEDIDQNEESEEEAAVQLLAFGPPGGA